MQGRCSRGTTQIKDKAVLHSFEITALTVCCYLGSQQKLREVIRLRAVPIFTTHRLSGRYGVHKLLIPIIAYHISITLYGFYHIPLE